MRIILVGYGKMGKAIEVAALAKGHQISARIDLHNTEDLQEAMARSADIAIEFTGPGSAYENVCRCLELGLPVVTGSTGWLEHYGDAIALCHQRQGALIHASNFSIGVNIFFEVNRQLSRLMAAHPAYDVQVSEVHHTQKKDAPSGTAIRLAEQIVQAEGVKTRWTDHQTENPSDLYIESERKEPYPGLHRVRYRSTIDEIEISHNALRRDGFAAGAILAAEFLVGRKGVFSMKDVLGLGEEVPSPGNAQP